MTQDEDPRADVVVTDPERLRALAHPIRVRLFNFLTDQGEATATECAEAIGESVASCSFHLRTLAKYGYVERADPRGREKPWRLTAPSWNLRPDGENPASLRAVRDVAVLGLDQEFQRVTAYFAAVADEPNEWVQATTFTRSSFWATAEELAEVSRALQEITQRFAGRTTDPSLRPEGARFSRMVAIANPEPLANPEPTTDGER